MGKMAQDIKRFETKMKEDADTWTRAFLLGLYGEVIRRTPVKEGRARGSWEMSKNLATNSSVDGPKNKSGRVKAPASLRSLAKNSDRVPVYISSALIYIVPLEHGHSKIQAPNGMVQGAVTHTVAQFRSGG